MVVYELGKSSPKNHLNFALDLLDCWDDKCPDVTTNNGRFGRDEIGPNEIWSVN